MPIVADSSEIVADRSKIVAHRSEIVADRSAGRGVAACWIVLLSSDNCLGYHAGLLPKTPADAGVAEYLVVQIVADRYLGAVGDYMLY